MKILFTCVGRRVELLQAFRTASNDLCIPLEIYATDISSTAPALMFCDKTYIAPKIDNEKYIPFLIKLCKDEKIEALIPTIDTDLLILAKNKEEFKKIGTQVFVSDYDKIEFCRDKLLTYDYFTSIGLCAPKTVDNINQYEGGFPAFIKPKNGSSSINAFFAQDVDQLFNYSKQINDYVIQPYISGTEYTVDIFCDDKGKCLYITPRIRLAVRSGEVLKTEIRQEKSIIKDMQNLVKNFKPIGAITVQLIRDEIKNKNFYIEINPRFGGGAPLSIKAGANSAEALLKILLGNKLNYIDNAAEDGAIFSRYDQSVRIQ